MSKRTAEGSLSANPTWEGLEEWVRGTIKEFIQDLLEQEVTELWGRARYQRHAVGDGVQGYRNG